MTTTTALAPAPKHGAVRNARLEAVGAMTSAELVGPHGRTFFAYAGRDVAVAEVYCVFCREWFETRGLMSALFFTVDHHHGEGVRGIAPAPCDRGRDCRFTKCAACGDPDFCSTHRICGTCGTRA